MQEKKFKTIVIILFIVVLILFLLWLWEYFVSAHDIPKRILPKPSDILTYLYKEFFTVHKIGYGSILSKSLQSFGDALIGFVISILLGSVIGITFSNFEVFRLILKPFVFITQLLPVPAFAPVVASILGYDIQTKIFIIVLFTIFPVIVTVEKTIIRISPNLKNLFKVYSASKIEILWKLIIPSIIPNLLTNAKILCTASFVTSIIAELPLTVSGGIGKDIFNSFNNQVNVRVWASIFVISFISMLFFIVVSKSEKFILTKYGFGQYEE